MPNGVKEGCVLAPMLYSMMFSAKLIDAFQEIPIRYCFDGKLLKLRRLQAKSKVQTEVLDMTKGAPTEEKMQKVWIKYLIHVTAMTSQSASKRLRWYIIQHLESLTRTHHHSERSTIASGRQVHLPLQYIVKSCAH